MSTASTTSRRGDTGRASPINIAEDSMHAEIEALLPARPATEARGRWFDLCFRLIILALAALWLLTPPAGGEPGATNEKAVATTR